MKEINNQETKNRRNDKNGKESQMMDRKKTTGKDSLGTQIEINVSFLDQFINQKNVLHAVRNTTKNIHETLAESDDYCVIELVWKNRRSQQKHLQY